MLEEKSSYLQNHIVRTDKGVLEISPQTLKSTVTKILVSKLGKINSLEIIRESEEWFINVIINKKNIETDNLIKTIDITKRAIIKNLGLHHLVLGVEVLNA